MSVVGGDELYVFHRSAFNSLIFGIAGIFYIFLYISYILYISKIKLSHFHGLSITVF